MLKNLCERKYFSFENIENVFIIQVQVKEFLKLIGNILIISCDKMEFIK